MFLSDGEPNVSKKRKSNNMDNFDDFRSIACQTDPVIVHDHMAPCVCCDTSSFKSKGLVLVLISFANRGP